MNNLIPRTLIDNLSHHNHNIRSDAVRALGRLEDVDTIPLLVERLRTEDDLFIREDITFVLTQRGQAAVAPLVGLLKDTDASVRHHAAHVLGKIKDAAAVESLMDALQDESETVVMKTVFALQQIRDSRAIPALVAILGHASLHVQAALVDVLEAFGAECVPALLISLTDPRWQVREQATDILGLIGDQTALPALTQALADEHPQVRFSAQVALRALA